MVSQWEHLAASTHHWILCFVVPYPFTTLLSCPQGEIHIHKIHMTIPHIWDAKHPMDKNNFFYKPGAAFPSWIVSQYPKAIEAVATFHCYFVALCLSKEPQAFWKVLPVIEKVLLPGTRCGYHALDRLQLFRVHSKNMLFTFFFNCTLYRCTPLKCYAD